MKGHLTNDINNATTYELKGQTHSDKKKETPS